MSDWSRLNIREDRRPWSRGRGRGGSPTRDGPGRPGRVSPPRRDVCRPAGPRLRSRVLQGPEPLLMPMMTMVQAIQDALRIALRDDPRVVVLGEDVGRAGGVFRVTEGLQAEFGEQRVVDTPLAENGIVGGAIGMALYGLKPVVEIQFVDFIYPAFDQIVSELAKMRWRSAGQYACPVVIRAPYGGGIRGGLYHSQSPEAYFCHTAGLTVVIPATPADAKGLLLSAMAGEDPVIFLEPKRLYRSMREEVPEGRFTTPLSQAAVVRQGGQC